MRRTARKKFPLRANPPHQGLDIDPYHPPYNDIKWYTPLHMLNKARFIV